MVHITRGIDELIFGKEHRTPVGAAVIRSGRDAQVTLQALVEVVAGFGASAEQSSCHQRAEHARGTQPAFHAQPEQIELGVVGDDLHRFERRLQLTEIVADGAEVDDPRLLVLHAQRQKANVAFPRVKAIASPFAIRFDVQRHGPSTHHQFRNASKAAAVADDLGCRRGGGLGFWFGPLLVGRGRQAKEAGAAANSAGANCKVAHSAREPSCSSFALSLVES